MNLARLAILSTAISTALLGGNVPPLLVDVNWLSSHLNDRGLVILHVGPKADYDAGHISGARYISLEDIALPATRKDPAELTLELPAPEVLRAKFEKFGVSNDSRIVVYFGAKQAFQSSTRVVFTLDYMGLGGQTWILNGGLPAWTAAGKPVTAEVPEVAAGAITARPVKNIVADAQLVKTIGQRPNQRLIDARSPNFYKGVDATYEKKGHIPGAINIPYSELLDSSLMLDRDRVAKVFAAVGVKPGDTVVAYCHIGQQATAVIFAARLLGHPVMLYDGSFQDWAIHSRGPVESDPAR